MKIKQENPPNYELLSQVFKVTKDNMFCYGDTIYNPNGCFIDEILIKHEEVHSRQQGSDPDKWWQRYILDSAFRFCQELEAYQVQFKEYKKVFKDRNKQARILDVLAQDLSSPTYGNVCTYHEALMSIRDNVKFSV